jgi:hypothetical protein
MRRFAILLGAISLVLVTAIPASAALQFRVALDGASEVGGGDPDGFGSARLEMRQDGTVCFDLRAENIEPVVVAHIHEAPEGVNGPIVVDFDVPANGLKACVSGDPAVVEAIRDDPAGYYVNLHNAPFPGGAVRGQLG